MQLDGVSVRKRLSVNGRKRGGLDDRIGHTRAQDDRQPAAIGRAHEEARPEQRKQPVLLGVIQPVTVEIGREQHRKQQQEDQRPHVTL